MVNQLLKTALGRLRIVAFIEGCSYLLLGFTMILKYKFAMPQPNYVVGLAHGILFVLYIVLLIQVSFLHRWNIFKMFMAFIASLIPFGTFYADKVLFIVNYRKIINTFYESPYTFYFFIIGFLCNSL
jgi:integral membrane protein